MFTKSKPKLKKALCKFLIFTMIFSIAAGNGLLRSKSAKAEGNAAQETLQEAAPVKTDTKDASASDDSALQRSDAAIKLQPSEALKAEDENSTTEQAIGADEGIIPHDITTPSAITSVKIANDPENFKNVKVGDKIVLKVQDQSGNDIAEDKLTFSVSDENVGIMDTKETDKFMARAKGIVTVTAALKDNESLKDQVTFDVADNIKDVFIRIEGYNHTILKRTEIKVPLYNISCDLGKASGSSGTKSAGWDTTKFNNPTNAHAIVYALKNLCHMHQIVNGEDDSENTFDFQDYGWSLYIAMIGGDREFDHGQMSGWMYRVNDDLPSIGCQGRDLKDGDDIVWYYGAFGFNNVYTKISADKNEAKAGEKIKVHLDGYTGGYSNKVAGLSKASILVTTGSAIDGPWEEYKDNDGSTVTTNDNGDAYLTFNTPGEYKISAVRYRNGNGRVKGTQQIDIVRPLPLTIEVKSLRTLVNEAIDSAGKIAPDNHNSWDWVAIGLARAGKSYLIPGDYLKNTEEYLKNPDNQNTFKIKPTEYERITLGVMAAGGDPANIGGINLIDKICNADLEKQGINAEVFALIALDSGNFGVPDGAKWNREKLINAILAAEVDGGGWSFGNSAPGDPDMTGMAMTALAPYNNEKYPKVKEAVKRAAEYLSSIQKDDGGYASWGTANSESCAQVIMGLCTNKIDPAGEKFTKKSGNVVTALLSFKVSDGGFSHVTDPDYGGGTTNGMANEQALYALDQYIYFLDNKGSIYEWGDKTRPVITVTGITDGEKTNNPDVAFKVCVTDDTDKNIVPAVKLNGSTITGTNGEYKATLIEGQNTIMIEAADAAGNKSDATYKLSYIKGATPTPGPTPGPIPGTTPDSKKVSVYIRVEGYGKTVVPREKITVSLFDLSPYLGPATGSSKTDSKGWGTNKFKGPTVAHAIVQALNEHGVHYDFQDYGWSLYIAMIDGDREFDQGPMSGWMYSVNGKLPPVGSQATFLKEGDDILWFYGAYGFDTLMTSLSASKTSVKTGEKVNLNLSGIKTTGADGKGTTGGYKQDKGPVGNASILVNGSEYSVQRNTVTTDDNGKATIEFDKAGTYKISAVRYKNSYIDIVPPLPITIHVTGSDINDGTGTGSAGGSGAAGGAGGSSGGSSNAADNSANNKNLNELKQKLQQISITSDQMTVQKQGSANVVTINENAVSSKINDVNNAIKEIESANGGKKIEGDVKVIPVKINEESSPNTVLKLQSSVIKCLNDNGFGLNVFFKDSDIKIPKEIITKMSTDYTYEIVKNSVKSDELNSAESLLTPQSKIISGACDVALSKVDKSGKEEQMGLNGTCVSIKVNAEDIKKLSKNSMKLCIYDKGSKKWTIANARYDDKNGMVTADIR